MKKALPVLIVIVIIAAGAWYYFNQPTTTPANTNQNDTANRSLSLTLAEQNQSSQSGTANIFEVGDKTKIELTLRNSPSEPQPAHIHTGSCAELGGVKYPLTFPVNGTSDTTLDVSYDELLAELPLAINVHKSVAEASVYVACADIKTNDGVSSAMPVIGGAANDMIVNNEPPTAPPDQASTPSPQAKVFNLTGKMFAFSQTEIRVNKGDTVTINFSSTEGFHDWTVDEFNARTKQVNTGEPASVTFTADKTGTFEYYCSVGQHRAMGMKGNLIVK